MCSNKEINKKQKYLTKKKTTIWNPTEKSLMLQNDMLPIISLLPKELGFEPDRVFVEQNKAWQREGSYCFQKWAKLSWGQKLLPLGQQPPQFQVSSSTRQEEEFSIARLPKQGLATHKCISKPQPTEKIFFSLGRKNILPRHKKLYFPYHYWACMWEQLRWLLLA